ncbi:hypothetical protein AMJ57_00115 [Parcubacteria bacterium SG8_24]|nr:MAG: hypothetical protein AMJ57_00115 [Parcubacteria bacterium SG8_24]
MGTPEKSEFGLSGVGAGEETCCDEVHVVVGDLHLSEGRTIRVPKRLSWFKRLRRFVRGLRGAVNPPLEMVETDNPLEDFHFDREFARFLDLVEERFRECVSLRLRLLGDTFDPLAVPNREGKFEPAPYEDAAVDEMRRIIGGHPAFFDALAAFVGRPGRHIDFFIGNHDLTLEWPAVRQELIRRLVGEDKVAARRIRFIGHEQDYEELHRDVLYLHGQDAEPHNGVDPKQIFITRRFGARLRRPVLNMSYGSYMTVKLVNRLKLRNHLVGRTRRESDLWNNALKHRWGWGLYAALVLVWSYFHSLLFSFWDLRRKTSIRRLFRTVLSTATRNPVDRFAKRLLEQRQDARVVIAAHSHNWRRESSEGGTYINCGTWVKKFRLVERQIDLRWNRLRWLELFWRCLLHFLKTGEVPMRRQMTKIAGFIAAVAAMATFLFTSFPREEWGDWSVTMSDFKIPIAIFCVFLVLAGLFRIFAVRPLIVPDDRLTFGLVRHFRNGDLKAELMEYLPAEDTFRECV